MASLYPIGAVIRAAALLAVISVPFFSSTAQARDWQNGAERRRPAKGMLDQGDRHRVRVVVLLRVAGSFGQIAAEHRSALSPAPGAREIRALRRAAGPEVASFSR